MLTLLRTILVSVFALSCLSAQPVTFGIKGGAPFGDVFQISGTTVTIPNSTGHFIIGPSIELHLPLDFGIEVDALHRNFSTASDSGGQWEFPILLKHYFFPPGPVRPYGEGGVNFNHLTGFSTLAKSPTAFIKDGSTGFTGGAGIEFKISRVRIAPELRVTFWKDANINYTLSSSGVVSHQTQASFLIGVSF